MPTAMPLVRILPRPQASWNVQRTWLLILTACIFIPFLNKAFHIDDPLFIWTAQHITISPWDFYGFDVNWYGYDAPISTIAKNPPLFSYYLAGWGSIFGWSEVSLHLACMIPSLAVVWGTFELARLWHAAPSFAVLAAICTPVFIMSGTSVMCDMAMVAFWVWAVYFWVRGLEERRSVFLAIAALFVLGSGLTKYFGISLIPLLAAYALMSRVPSAHWRRWLFLALAGFVAYELWTKYLYGIGLLSDAVGYASSARQNAGGGRLWGLPIGLAFLGGGCSVLLFCAPLWLHWRGWLWAMLGVLALAVVLSGSGVVAARLDGRTNLLWEMALWVVVGGGLCYWMIQTVVREQCDPVAWTLCFWIGGTLLFAAYINWTVSARNILPLVPAIGLLMGRSWARIRPRWRSSWACLLPSLCLGLAVAYADFLWANETRVAVQYIVKYPLPAGARGWFLGHWGGQYYLEKAGWLPLSDQPTAHAGDWIVRPSRGTNMVPLDVDKINPLYRIALWPDFPLSVVESGAGYYACITTSGLPFTFVRPAVSYYTIYSVK